VIPTHSITRAAAAFATIVVWIGLLAAAFIEWIVYYPLPSWFYGAALAFAALGVACRLTQAPRPLPGPARRSVYGWVLVGAALFALHLVPWTSRKPFLRRLYSIEPGMTYDEVLERMDDYMLGTGLPANPFLEDASGGYPRDYGQVVVSESFVAQMSGSLCFRHSDEGSFNRDFGIVVFDAGRVVKVRFEAD